MHLTKPAKKLYYLLELHDTKTDIICFRFHIRLYYLLELHDTKTNLY